MDSAGKFAPTGERNTIIQNIFRAALIAMIVADPVEVIVSDSLQGQNFAVYASYSGGVSSSTVANGFLFRHALGSLPSAL